MAAWLFSWISSLNTDVLTEWFIWIMLILFFAAIAIFLTSYPKFLLRLPETTPTLLTTLGILGTFLGIAIGLVHFDVSDIDGSIPKLLEGLQVAFLTSIVGIVLSIVLKIFFSFKEKAVETEEVQANDPNAVFELLKQQKALLEQLRDQHQLQRGEAQDFYRTIQTAVQGGFQGMQKELHDFAEKVSKNNSEQLIQALKEVIGDFNAKINEQFGENFKQLNQGVEKLVTWQENYKNHLEKLQQIFIDNVKTIQLIKVALEQISKESQAIPQAMQQLQNIMQGLNQQLKNSEVYLKSFAAITGQAEQMLPTLHAHLNAMQERLAEALELFEKALKNTTANINNALKNSSDSLSAAAGEIQKATAETAEIITEIQQQQHQFSEDIEDFSGQLTSKLTEVMNKLDTQQTALFTKLKNNLEELQKQQTDSIDKKMIAIDASMEKEITRVMQEMAKELTAITGEFVKQYKDLTTKLNDLIKEYEKLQRSKQP